MTGETKQTSRIASIDIMRGLVIVLMMLDHVRERFYMHTRTGDPMFDTIEPDLFFTRFLTHFCAPTFIFLAGLSSWLYAHPAPGVTRPASAFLFKRGLVIIGIELVFYYLVWADGFANFLFLQVLFAIGVCMIALSLLCRLPAWLIGALGMLLVFGHNLLTPIDFAPGEPGYVLWTVLHDGGDVAKIGGLTISLSYPVLPWIGVIALGYCAGPLYAKGVESAVRMKWLIGLGLACLMTLAILRGFNIYGETLPWSAQGSAIETVMAFLNYTKYPPSLNYIQVTLGGMFFALAALETIQTSNPVLRALKDYGSVPMFIYIFHLYVLLAAYWILYGVVGANHGARFGLNTVGQIWLGAALLVLICYPVARWFARYKHREKHNKPWLSYF